MRDGLPEQLQWVWDTRWASYWIGDPEYFDFKERDFDAKAHELAEAGVNAVITFGGFHFRWSFVAEWTQLLEVLRKVVRSCHDYGIKVVEHHSAILTHNPWGQKEWDWTIYVRKAGRVDLKRHPSFMEGIRRGDLQHKGAWLSHMRQIDPRTGQYARTNYRGWGLCLNNPLWQKLYFEHLEDIYACGVDGIMTDDIQFWPVGYGCGCPYCRQQFTEATGYEMPPNGLDDGDFYGNMHNPTYRAWILWRRASTAQHQRRVIAHFRSLGLELSRPMYSSSDTSTWAAQGLAGGVEHVLDICSTIFTEVLSVDAQGHTWLGASAQSKHRSALAYRRGVPPMCLFYPHNVEENFLCWALTKSWGQRYWGTRSTLTREEEAEMMRPVFRFESAHPELYERPEPLSEVGVLFSAQTRNTYKGMDDAHCVHEWAGWCQTLLRANILFDTIIDPDLAERQYWDRLKLLILPNTAHISDAQVEAAKDFVERGGNLVVTHEAGMYDETGAPRKAYPLSDLVGANPIRTEDAVRNWQVLSDAPVSPSTTVSEQGPIVLFQPYDDAEVWMPFQGTSYPAVFYHRFGAGQVLTFAGKPGTKVRMVGPERYHPDPENPNLVGHYVVNYNRDEMLAQFLVDCVQKLLGEDQLLSIHHVPDGILLGAFHQRDRIVVHMVNVAGTLADNGKQIPVAAPLHFPDPASLPGGAPIMQLRLRCPGERATLLSPEIKDEKELTLHREGAYAVVEIPSGFLRCYSVVSILS